jgi:hypothetical protein
METNLPVLSHKFSCISCNIRTNNKKDYNNHILTAKHSKLTTVNNEETQIPNIIVLICEKCNKKYKSRVGLWKHKKQCINIKEDTLESTNIINSISNNTTDKDALIIQLLKQNGELQKSLIELSKEKTVTNNTSNNNNNKTFNLNFFLNETCKDALNIQDFVSSIHLSLEDLENTGRQGYIEGISNIILKNLNNLEHYKRPIHCSDSKREILYIKDNNKWEKECENKPILTKAIKMIANENIKQIKGWKDKYPDCTNSDSNKNNLYLKIVSNSMNGSTQEESHKNINKIINNVAKDTIIQKDI